MICIWEIQKLIFHIQDLTILSGRFLCNMYVLYEHAFIWSTEDQWKSSLVSCMITTIIVWTAM